MVLPTLETRPWSRRFQETPLKWLAVDTLVSYAIFFSQKGRNFMENFDALPQKALCFDLPFIQMPDCLTALLAAVTMPST